MITGFAGSMAFVRLHIVWFAVWIAVNFGVLAAALTFDPYRSGC
jgi:uncharacterized membrane protein